MIYHVRHVPKHPRASSSGCVPVHILVAEAAFGRYLPQGAQIHHVDGNPENNAPKNLVICQDRAYHKLLHVRERILRAGGDPNTQALCATCKLVKNRRDFHKMRSNVGTGLQKRCIDCAKVNDKGRWRRGKVSDGPVRASLS